MTRISTFISLLAIAVTACTTGNRGIRVESSAPPTNSSSGGGVQRTTSIDWPSLARWEQTDESPDDVAVIVAIEDYAFLPDVPGAARNAADWKSYFESRGMEDVYVVTDADAPAEEMLRFAEVAASAARDGATVWYVFIGHGAPSADGEDGVLVGMDARQTPSSLTSRGVRQSKLLAALNAGQQDHTVVIVDACFSGRTSDGATLAPGAQPVIALNSDAALDGNTTILTAAKSNQFAGALPGSSRPAFSYLLLGALRGWADDGDGTVTTTEAHEWVARQLRHVRGRTQTPGLDGAEATLTKVAREPDPGISERMRDVTTTTAEPRQEPPPTEAPSGSAYAITERLSLAPPGAPGWRRSPASETAEVPLFYRNDDGSWLAVGEFPYPDSRSARADARRNWALYADGKSVVTPKTEQSFNGNRGLYAEFAFPQPHPDDPRVTVTRHMFLWQYVRDDRVWLFILEADEDFRNGHVSTFSEVLKTARFK